MKPFTLFSTLFAALCLIGGEAFADSIPLADRACEPSALVAGAVHVFHGSYQEQQADLVLPGPDSLSFQRSYSSVKTSHDSICGTWHTTAEISAFLIDHRSRYALRAPAGDGTVPFMVSRCEIKDRHFRGTHLKQQLDFHFDTAQLDGGVTNTSGGELGGHTNLRHHRGHYDPRQCTIFLHLPNGGEKHYYFRNKSYNELFLSREILPSGNRLLYNVDKRGITVRCVDPTEQVNYSHYTITPSAPNQWNVTCSDGRTIRYTYHLYRTKDPEIIYTRRQITQVERSDAPPVIYRYACEKDKKERVSARELPDGRFLGIEYYWRGPHSLLGYSFAIKENSPMHGFVKTLSAPAGACGESVPIYSFVYHAVLKPEKHNSHTEVRNALGHRSDYRSDSIGNLQQIERWNHPDASSLHSITRFYWGKKELAGNLLSRTLCNGDGEIVVFKGFHYDADHNVDCETVAGDLSGWSKVAPRVDAAGNLVETQCESYSTHYTHSADRFHHRLSEQTSDGKCILYSYRPESSLLASKLTSDGNKIYSRIFHRYDSFGNCIETIQDDGSSENPDDLRDVMLRQVRRVTPKPEAPCFGFPIAIEELCVDPADGSERLIKREENHYSLEGHLIEKRCYAADGSLAYQMLWEHNAMGKVISECDPLGLWTYRDYDANGNQIYERSPSGVEKWTHYDLMDRPISVEERHPDGVELTTQMHYDAMGQMIRKVDSYGRSTHYSCDVDGNVAEIHLPPSADRDGQTISPTIIQRYDLAGNCIERTDELGATIRTRYTIRGKPCEVIYPDGSRETYGYTPEGYLEWECAKSGAINRYEYDCEGRWLKKARYGSDGALLSTVERRYKGQQLVEEIEANGARVRYFYNLFGQVERVEKEGVSTQFFYDQYGNRAETVEEDGDGRIKRSLCRYDQMSRVIEEKILDGREGIVRRWVSYSYDLDGNRVEECVHTDEGTQTTRRRYNTRGECIEVRDAEGHLTMTHYDRDQRDALGQRILEITEVDPNGYRTIKRHDVYGNCVEERRTSPLGATVAASFLHRNAAGLCLQRDDQIYLGDRPLEGRTTRWEYDSLQRVTAISEAVGTPLEKTVRTTYTPHGEREAVIHPDGLIEQMEYDSAGRLKRHWSSDGSIDIAFEYDAHDHIIRAADLKSGRETLRRYDAFDRLVEERFENGLEVGYCYDTLGRVESFILPDRSSIHYCYDAVDLRAVERRDQRGAPQYCHRYSQIDLAGNVREAILPLCNSPLALNYDSLNRVRELIAPTYREEVPAEGIDAAGNLLQRRLVDPVGQLNCSYSYDHLYQLQRESGVCSHSYTHDSLYNRRSRDAVDHTVNALNQLTEAGALHYRYDLRGNRVQQTDREGDETRYLYDALGQLIAVEREGEREEYSYDAFHRRMSRKRYGTSFFWGFHQIEEERYFYCGDNEIGATDAAGAIVQLRLLGSGRGAEIGATVAIEVGGNVYSAIHDQMGNIAQLYDCKRGYAAESYRYGAFGECLIYDSWGWQSEMSRVGNPWRFSSKRCDATGLVYYGRRYYDPAVGRWLTPDPAGYSAGPNLYAFVKNAPTNQIDLYGLFSCHTRCHAHHGHYHRSFSQNKPHGKQRTLPGTPQQRLHHQIDRTIRAPGRLITAVSRHLPSPLREVGCTAGTILAFDHVNPDRAWPEPKSQVYEVGEGEPVATSINGIINDRADAISNGENISKQMGNGRVHVVHNQTNGFCNDLIESAANLCGVATRPVREAVRQICKDVQYLNSCGRSSDRAVFFAHSQGGAIMDCARRFLPKEVRDRVELYTFGSAKLAQEGDWGHCHNFVNTNDIVPWFDFKNRLKASMGMMPNTTIMQSKWGIPFSDHMMDGENYSGARQKVIGKIMKRRNQ